VREFRHDSELLRDNPLGDPHVRGVPVYLPPDYSDRRKEPYPVVFMLAGWSGRANAYLSDRGAFSPRLADELDRLTEQREMRPTIVVFPDCSTRLGASQYVNSAATGPYMDYLCDELVDWVDRRFHTHASRDYRGVVGHSSGGFGALVTGMLRSDRFAAICSSAGDSFFEHCFRSEIPTVIRELRDAGGVKSFVDAFLANPNPCELLSHDKIVSMLYLSMASCFAPNPAVPVIHGDLWFDLETGETVDEPYKRLLDWDPVHMVARHLTELRALRWIHLEAGSEDEHGLHLGHRQFAARLRKHGIDYVLEEYPGGHRGHHHRNPYRVRRMVDRMYEA
jgi:enterochelin esterase family protein